MRCLALFVVSLGLAAMAAAQEQTLFQGDVKTGGFGGPVVKYTRIKGQDAVMVGGRGGWILNHSLILGGGGYGVATEVDAPEGIMPQEGPLDIEFGYGGFEMEYLVRPNALTHLSFYALIGGGALNFVKDVGPVSESNQQVGEADVVFALEPAVSAELNVTKWFRLSAGGSYRLVTGVNRAELENRDFSGLAATLTFKFGKF
jgi:hypothetical protein